MKNNEGIYSWKLDKTELGIILIHASWKNDGVDLEGGRPKGAICVIRNLFRSILDILRTVYHSLFQSGIGIHF